MIQQKFIPILMSTPMVIANLNGSKNQTRRILVHGMDISEMEFAMIKDNQAYFKDDENNWWGTKLKYQVGDILWARETFMCVGFDDKGECENGKFIYKADNPDLSYYEDPKWKPSLFMPKSACRIFLEVIEVRVERLNDISEQDAIDEGIIPLRMSRMQLAGSGQLYLDYSKKVELFNEGVSPIQSYKSLWESINGEDSWADNPFVWVVKYKRIEKPENFL